MPNYDDTIIQVKEDDPWRCQATNSQGQCINKATTLGGTCPVHGGNRSLEVQEQKNIRLYRLNKFQQQLNRHADAPELKSLREEIALLRMLLEERINACGDMQDLLMCSHQISDLVTKIERVVKTCHSLESSMGSLLDKQAILHFASQVIDILTESIDDEIIINTISDKLMEAVSNCTTSK